MSIDRFWYAGRCVRARKLYADVEVLSRRIEGRWESLENPHKLFPKSGTVELRLTPGMPLLEGGWVAFQPLDASRPGSAPRIGRQYLLPRFIDLAHVDSVEGSRRLLVDDGWPTGAPPGRFAVRISPAELILVTLVRKGADSLSATNAAKVPSFDFDATCVIEMFTRDLLYDAATEAHPRAVYNWSPNKDYISRVVAALGGADDPRLGDLIAWLELDAETGVDRVQGLAPDIENAYAALRSGGLAKRLSEDQRLLANFFDVVRRDQSIASIIDSKVQQILNEERSSIHNAEIQRVTEEVETLRASAIADVQREVDNHQAEQLQLEERNRADARRGLEAEIAAERAIALGELQGELLRIREESKSAVADGEAILRSLEVEVERSEARLKDVKLEIRSLEDQEASAKAAVDRLLKMDAALNGLTKENYKPKSLHGKRATTLSEADFVSYLKTLPILTPEGRELAECVVALMLAGECPVLSGPDAEAVLNVLEALLCCGDPVHIEADPTLISFEDLWSRPWQSYPSPLAEAIALANGKPPRTVVVVFKSIERCPSRFWLPSLLDHMRRELVPRRLLVCATLTDIESDEVAHLGQIAPILKVAEAIESELSALGAVALDATWCRDFEPEARAVSLAAEMATVSTLQSRMEMSRSLRVARVASELGRLRGLSVERACRSTLDLFTTFADTYLG